MSVARTKAKGKAKAKADAGLPGKVLEWCAASGLWAWRANSGKIFTGHRMIILGEPGTPDVLIVYKGRLLGVECKAPTGKRRASQLAWISKAREHGVRATFAFSLDEAAGWITEQKDEIDAGITGN